MRSDFHNFTNGCDGIDIAGYLDGELPVENERRVDEHLSGCSGCREELRLQREILSAIESVAEEPPNIPDVPPGFARVVTVNAESSVSGIRSPSERLTSAFIGAFLVLIVAASLLTDGGVTAFQAAERLTVQTLTVIGFLFHSALEIGTGVGIVLRCFGQGVLFGSEAASLLTVTFFTLAAAVLTRMVVRYNRLG